MRTGDAGQSSRAPRNDEDEALGASTTTKKKKQQPAQLRGLAQPTPQLPIALVAASGLLPTPASVSPPSANGGAAAVVPLSFASPLPPLPTLSPEGVQLLSPPLANPPPPPPPPPPRSPRAARASKRGAEITSSSSSGGSALSSPLVATRAATSAGLPSYGSVPVPSPSASISLLSPSLISPRSFSLLTRSPRISQLLPQFEFRQHCFDYFYLKNLLELCVRGAAERGCTDKIDGALALFILQSGKRSPMPLPDSNLAAAAATTPVSELDAVSQLLQSDACRSFRSVFFQSIARIQSFFFQLRGDLRARLAQVERALKLHILQHEKIKKARRKSEKQEQQQQQQGHQQPPHSFPPAQAVVQFQEHNIVTIARLRGGSHATTSRSSSAHSNESLLTKSDTRPTGSTDGRDSDNAPAPAAAPSPSVTLLSSCDHPLWSDLLFVANSLQRCAQFVVLNYLCMWHLLAGSVDGRTLSHEDNYQAQIMNLDDPLNLADSLVELIEEMQAVAQLAIMAIADAPRKQEEQQQQHTTTASAAQQKMSNGPASPALSHSSDQTQAASVTPSPSPLPVSGVSRYVQSSRAPTATGGARVASDNSSDATPGSRSIFIGSSSGNHSGGNGSSIGGNGSSMEDSLRSQSESPPSPSGLAHPSTCDICEAHASCGVVLSVCKHTFCLACLLTHPSFGIQCPACAGARFLVLQHTRLSLSSMLFENVCSQWEELCPPRSASTGSQDKSSSSRRDKSASPPPMVASGTDDIIMSTVPFLLTSVAPSTSTTVMDTTASSRSGSGSGLSPSLSDSQQSALTDGDAASFDSVRSLLEMLTKHADAARALDPAPSPPPSRSHKKAKREDNSLASGLLVERLIESARHARRRASDQEAHMMLRREAVALPSSSSPFARAVVPGRVRSPALSTSSVRSASAKNKKRSRAASGNSVSPPAVSAPDSPRVAQAAMADEAAPAAPAVGVADEEDEDDDDLSRGVSCHQCKVSKPPSQMRFCANARVPRKTPSGLRSTSAKPRASCQKKYCFVCLARLYGEAVGGSSKKASDGSDVSADASSAAEKSAVAGPAGISVAPWQCPSCRGECFCANCCRKTGKSTPRAVAREKLSNTPPVAHRHLHKKHCPAPPSASSSPSLTSGGSSSSTSTDRSLSTAAREALAISSPSLGHSALAAILPRLGMEASSRAQSAGGSPMSALRLADGVARVQAQLIQEALPSSRSSSGGQGSDPSTSSGTTSSSSSSSSNSRSIRSLVDNDDRQIQQALERDQQMQEQQLMQTQRGLVAAASSSVRADPATSLSQTMAPQSGGIDDLLPALTSDFLATASQWKVAAREDDGHASRYRAEAEARAVARADERAQGHRARMEAERHAQLAARAAANPSVAAAASSGIFRSPPSQPLQGVPTSMFLPSDASLAGVPALPAPASGLPSSTSPPAVEVNWAAVQRILNANGGSMQQVGDGGEFTTFTGATGAALDFASSHADLRLNPSHPLNGGLLSPSFSHEMNWRAGAGGPPQPRDNNDGMSGNGSDDSERIKAHSASADDHRSASASRSPPDSGGSATNSNERAAMSMTPPADAGNINSSGSDEVNSDASRKSTPDSTMEGVAAVPGASEAAAASGAVCSAPLEDNDKHRHKHSGVSQHAVRDAVAAAAAARGQWDSLMSPSDLPHGASALDSSGGNGGFGPSMFSSSPPLTTSFYSPFSRSFPVGAAVPNGAAASGNSSSSSGGLGLPSLPNGDSSGSDGDAPWRPPRPSNGSRAWFRDLPGQIALPAALADADVEMSAPLHSSESLTPLAGGGLPPALGAFPSSLSSPFAGSLPPQQAAAAAAMPSFAAGSVLLPVTTSPNGARVLGDPSTTSALLTQSAPAFSSSTPSSHRP